MAVLSCCRLRSSQQVARHQAVFHSTSDLDEFNLDVMSKNCAVQQSKKRGRRDTSPLPLCLMCNSPNLLPAFNTNSNQSTEFLCNRQRRCQLSSSQASDPSKLTDPQHAAEGHVMNQLPTPFQFPHAPLQAPSPPPKQPNSDPLPLPSRAQAEHAQHKAECAQPEVVAPEPPYAHSKLAGAIEHVKLQESSSPHCSPSASQRRKKPCCHKPFLEIHFRAFWSHCTYMWITLPYVCSLPCMLSFLQHFLAVAVVPRCALGVVVSYRLVRLIPSCEPMFVTHCA